MVRVKRVFILGNFPDLSLPTMAQGRYFWIKGLTRLGCDVQTFSYRNAMTKRSPGGNKALARLFGKRAASETLVSQIKSYQPNIVLVAGVRVKDLSSETLVAMRKAAPDAVFVALERDCHPEIEPARQEVAEHMDIVLATAGGTFLQSYKALGVKRCGFMPNLCDPDLQYRYEVGDEWKSKVLFTGQEHTPKYHANSERSDLLHRVAQMRGARLYGCLGNPFVHGLDYFRAISGTRIAVSINMVNDVRLYHSNRLVNNIACGAFTLARRVPDTDLLFQDNVHLRYFDTTDEFFELADWYLAHDQERERLALAGMEYAHQEYNCQRMSQHLLDLVEKGRVDAPWAEII
jgi:hypothetical protein